MRSVVSLSIVWLVASACGNTITGDFATDSGAAEGTDAADGASDGADGADGASDGADGASDGADGGSDGADGTGGPVDCQTDWDPTFFGTIAEDRVTSTPYGRDAGLGAVLAAARALDEGRGDNVSLTLTNVAVTNVVEKVGEDYTITLGDGAGHVLVYRVPLPTTPEPGMVLSATVRRVENYSGTLEITELDSISVSGATSEVYVYDSYGASLDVALQESLNVRLYGEVTSADGACGGDFQCFTLTHGLSTETVRTRRSLEVGDCAIVTAPVARFEGAAQLDLRDDGWMQVTPGG